MREYNIKWGKWLFVRWLIVGWTLQAVHVLDNGEKTFRILLELFFIAIIFLLSVVNLYSSFFSFALFLLLHSCFWLFDSTWLVGFREVYHGFKGKGLLSIISFMDWSIEELKECDNIVAITIYGSICRHNYHDRSDFDLRIVQERGSLITYFKMIKLRIIATFKYRIPLDLKLVDSQSFLQKEMREDEHPIIVYDKFLDFYDKLGDSYNELRSNPERFKKTN